MTAPSKPSRSHTSRRSRRPSAAPPETSVRRVLVTGASGLVGRRVLPLLRQRGWEVVAVERRLRHADAVPGTIQLTADLCSPGWQTWCRGCTALLHLAGAYQDEPGAESRLDSVHPSLTRHVVDASPELGISRAVMLSALGASAQAPTRFHVTKWQAEEVFRRSPLEWTVLQAPPLFGPGDHWSGLLAAALKRLPFFPLLGEGAGTVQPLAVDEAAGLLVELLDRPDTSGSTIQVGGPEVLSYREVVRRTAAAAGTRFRPVFLSPGQARWLLPLIGRVAGVPLTRGPLGLVSRGGVPSGSPGIPWTPRLRYQGPTWRTAGP